MATKTYFKLSPSQSGRSMVEIIGVLAIVGVLSIGGIMGYSYAMDKYRANTTVNDIMLRATDLLAQANQGHTAHITGVNMIYFSCLLFPDFSAASRARAN